MLGCELPRTGGTLLAAVLSHRSTMAFVLVSTNLRWVAPTLLAAVLLAALLAGAEWPIARASGRPRAPDVVLLMLDTVRNDHLSLNGYPRATTPELADFAKTATRFARAYAQSSWTAPSVTSLLTSRYPRELGIAEQPSGLAPDSRSLARVLQSHGYRTLGVTTNLFISRRYGHELGYDRFDETLIASAPTITSDRVTDRALDLVREVEPDTPIFLYAHYFDPHYDYTMHAGFELGALPVALCTDDPSVSFLQLSRRPALSDDELDAARWHYDSELAFTDYHVGRLLSGLRALGRFDDAVVVIVADHGEEFLEHGHIGHSRSVHDELLHVPLLIKAPRQRRRHVRTEPVALLGVAPTLLSLADLPPEPSYRGADLFAAGARVRPIFASTFRSAPFLAVVDGYNKGVLDLRSDRLQVFDLAADPYEQHPLRDERVPALAQALRARLDAWNESLSIPPPSHTALSPGEQAMLRALGYAD